MRTQHAIRCRRRLRADRRHRRHLFGRLVFALAVFMTLVGIEAPADDEPPTTVLVSGGAGVSVSDDTAAFPGLDLEVDAPIYVGRSAIARLDATLSLAGLPGEEQLSFSGDLSTFRAAVGRLAVRRRIGSSREWGQGVYLEASGAFWSRLVTRDVRPRDRFARETSLGVRIEHREVSGGVDRYLSVRWGRSDLAAEAFGWGQFVIAGRAQVVEAKGVHLLVGAEAHVDIKRTGAGRDVFLVSVSVGR